MIVKEGSYETSEPTVDLQVVTLQGSGADVFLIAATPKFAAQAIRKSSDLDWAATRYLSYVSALRRRRPQTRRPRQVEGAHHRLRRHRRDRPAMEGYSRHAGVEGVHRQIHVGDRVRRRPRGCGLWLRGDNRAGAEAMRERPVAREHHAAGGQSQKVPPAAALWPGITVNTSPTNYSPVRQLQLATFNGANWEPVGEVLSD